MVERGNFWKMVTLWISVALAKRMVAALGLVNARGEKEFSKHKHLFILVFNSLYLINFYSIGNCCQRRSSHLPRSMNTMWYGSYITLPLAVLLSIHISTKKYTAAFLRRRISRQRVMHRACIWMNNNFSKKQNSKINRMHINWLTHQYFLDPMTNSVFADRAWREERSTWCPLEVRYHRLHLPK